jgi:Lactonase, 7-bladed beta-propeller
MASINWFLATVLVTAACGGASTADDAPPPPPGAILAQPSRSSTIAITDDGSHVAMVNPDDGSLSIFQTSDDSRTAKVATGGTPASVALAANNTTAYVANRADGTVVRVTGIDSTSAAVDATVQVGAEPVALALSPTGKQLFVAELAESRVSVIDTASMTLVQSFAVDRPRALLVTNNGDASDTDETLIVPQYYGVPVAGREAKDDGRTGSVRMFALADLTQAKEITLAPLATGFFEGDVPTNPEVTASPNQLGALATANGRIYITSVSAAPDGATRFDNNVFPIVYVADVAAAQEVRDASGTTNLARKIYDANPDPSPTNPRFIPGELSDLAFVDGSAVAYAIGRAGDVMVRVTFGDTVSIGSTQNTEIDLAGNATVGKCQEPIGLAINSASNKAYVNCWITRDLGIVDLSAQT